eukprot:612018-Pelagomonas_calceolata.AAC.1
MAAPIPQEAAALSRSRSGHIQGGESGGHACTRHIDLHAGTWDTHRTYVYVDHIQGGGCRGQGRTRHRWTPACMRTGHGHKHHN